MPTFLFWNLQKKPLLPRVERLARVYAVDVVVLAEVNGATRVVPLGGFDQIPLAGDRLLLFDRSGSAWQPELSGPLGRWAGFRVRPIDAPAYNVFVAHLPSKLHADENTQRLDAASLAEDIRAVESKHDERTVLLGDLNCNPFEAAIAGAAELHAVCCRTVARRERRTIGGRSYPLFYNPMWSMFGDRTPGRPPGTYYRAAGQAVNYFWNVFDQVLLRPALMDALAFL